MSTVTERALIRRINRRLPGCQRLRKYSGGRWESDFGRYYIEDDGSLIAGHVDLQALARELNALGTAEQLV